MVEITETGKQIDFGPLATAYGATIIGGSEIVKAVLELVGRTIEAIGSAAAAVDPLQFAFMVGTGLFALNYFDQTEPYSSIIRKLNLHNLIKGLHMPGEASTDLSMIKDAADCCITEFQFAGKPVPSQLYQLRDATGSVASFMQTIDNIIPGAGAAENWLTGVLNGFGIKTASQILADQIPKLKQWCKDQTGQDCNTPPPPVNVPPGTLPGIGPGTISKAGPFNTITDAARWIAQNQINYRTPLNPVQLNGRWYVV